MDLNAKFYLQVFDLPINAYRDIFIIINCLI
jgi:hypothetical protein